MKAAITILAAIGIFTASTVYPAALEVTEINGDKVTMQTATGFAYTVDGPEDWKVGDVAAAIMWNHGTKHIGDDVVISARYAGWNHR